MTKAMEKRLHAEFMRGDWDEITDKALKLNPESNVLNYLVGEAIKKGTVKDKNGDTLRPDAKAVRRELLWQLTWRRVLTNDKVAWNDYLDERLEGGTR